MSLGDSAIQRFLATKDVAILATVQADGAPLAMPMWFLHDPASLTMISVEGTHKVRNLRRDARVCVVAEAGSGGGDERGVTVLGKAEFLADGPERRSLELQQRAVARQEQIGHLYRRLVVVGGVMVVALLVLLVYLLVKWSRCLFG